MRRTGRGSDVVWKRWLEPSGQFGFGSMKMLTKRRTPMGLILRHPPDGRPRAVPPYSFPAGGSGPTPEGWTTVSLDVDFSFPTLSVSSYSPAAMNGIWPDASASGG